MCRSNGPPHLPTGSSSPRKNSSSSESRKTRDFGRDPRCLFAPSTPLVPDLSDNYVQIIQGRDQIALLTDINWRIATLDGRPHTSNKLRTWSGDARAHWEGETLVVETKNFTNR